MSTQDVTLLRPGTKIVVADASMDMEHPATVLQQFNGCLYYLSDDPATSESGWPVEWVTYKRVLNGEIDVRVVDDSTALEIEVVEEPRGGLTVEERVGPEIASLTHEDPAQSGPPTTHIARLVVEPRDVIHALQRVAFFEGPVTITIEGSHSQEMVVRVQDRTKGGWANETVFRGSWEEQIAPALVEYDRKRGER